MVPMNSDGELPNGIPPTSQPAGERSSSNGAGARYAGLSGVPSHLRSDHVEPSVASYQIHLPNPSAQCIQCFQCRQTDTPSGSRRTDDTDEKTGHGSVTKLVPF